MMCYYGLIMDKIMGIKEFIENNPVSLATVTDEGKPNVIGVAFVRVVSEEQILITDNYMNQTIKDISQNKNICLLVWDSEMHGYKLVGEAEYHATGEWKKYVEAMEENRGLPAKGAIIVKVSKIIPSK